jgi:hypothetical protein
MRWPIWRVAVAERSMEPALLPGDWLIASHPGRAGQPGRPGLLLVKRAARRAPGGWWLESDNPGAGAVDSRAFGVVPPELIEGAVLFRYWPARRGN